MGFLSVLSYAQKLIEQTVNRGDIAIDATVGNGVDTEFLAARVGPTGTVHGFDIQNEALDRARERLHRTAGHPDRYARVHLHHRSHAEMNEALPAVQHGQVAAVMFNLGYLPGSDQITITTSRETIPALATSLDLLRPGGIITIVIYTGHDGGMEEADAVEQWVASLPQERCQVIRYQYVNRGNHPPYLIAVAKK